VVLQPRRNQIGIDKNRAIRFVRTRDDDDLLFATHTQSPSSTVAGNIELEHRSIAGYDCVTSVSVTSVHKCVSLDFLTYL
jgi:hypothetical protein